MGALGGNGRLSRIARVLGLCTGCLVLANCSSGNLTSRADPEYGMAASARVTEPAPKSGDAYRVGKPYIVGRHESDPQQGYSAAVANVPELDMTASCYQAGIAARSEKRGQLCLDSERKWHDQLVKHWSDFEPADRAACVNMQRSFQPNYTELLTCLEMARDARSISTEQSLKALAKQ